MFNLIDPLTNNVLKEKCISPCLKQEGPLNTPFLAIASEAAEMQRDYAAICRGGAHPKSIVLPGLIGVYPGLRGKYLRIISREISNGCNAKLIMLEYSAKLHFVVGEGEI